MNFDSLLFLVLLGVTLIVAWVIADYRWRVRVLLGVSYVFYATWDARFLVLFIWLTLLAWGGALLLAGLSGRNRRLMLWGILVLLLVPLAFFKYFNFLGESITELMRVTSFEQRWAAYDIVLPVGISFFTFHAISYVLDVHAGRLRPDLSISRIGLYLAFFPHLIAGPIVRATDFLPQVRVGWEAPTRLIMAGALGRFAWGMFKKVILADRLALTVVDPVFAQPELASATLIVLAIIAFGLLIYADFSGYSDMAIASAAMLGIRFRENFHAPYLATSIRDFWRRWHISLSSWIRDYVYIPLGGSRSGSESRTAANLLMAMTLCGLWHGAAWTFVAWGMLRGLAIVGERFLVPRLPASRLWPLVSWCVTTLIVFTSWALFRANNFDVLAALIAGLLGEADVYIHKAVWVFVVMAALILYAEQAVLMLWPAVAERPGVVALARKWISRSISLRILIATTLTVLLLLLHYPQLGGRNFIYFQF